MDRQNNCTCKKCKENFIFLNKETWWNNYGTYSVKLVKCPYCETINSVKLEEASGLDVNNDRRYY